MLLLQYFCNNIEDDMILHTSYDLFLPSGDMGSKQKGGATSWKPEKSGEDGSVTSRLHQDYSDDAVMV